MCIVRSTPMVPLVVAVWTTVNKSGCSKQALLEASVSILLEWFSMGLSYSCVWFLSSGRLPCTGARNVSKGEGSGTIVLEVKFRYRYMSIWCEGCYSPVHFNRSGTKVRGSKMIRYRRSPNYKRYQQEIGSETIYDPFRIQGKPQVFGFWGEYSRKAET